MCASDWVDAGNWSSDIRVCIRSKAFCHIFPFSVHTLITSKIAREWKKNYNRIEAEAPTCMPTSYNSVLVNAEKRESESLRQTHRYHFTNKKIESTRPRTISSEKVWSVRKNAKNQKSITTFIARRTNKANEKRQNWWYFYYQRAELPTE